MVAQKTLEIHVLLHNIRSAHNVGSIFRTADAVAVSKIYLSGYTPAPVDRFGRARADISKASLGAEKTVAWESVGDIQKFMKDMKHNGFQICAVEQDDTSIDYREIPRKEKILIIMGNEVDGVGKEILSMCDTIAEIPMLGEKESLNVSVAAGVVLYCLV
ncbi:MAG: TrmH family RNA methyltransferase [Patescibacteria group bacterium]